MQSSSKLSSPTTSFGLSSTETTYSTLTDYAHSLLEQLPEGQERKRVLSALLMTAINYQLKYLAAMPAHTRLEGCVSNSCPLSACKKNMQAIVQSALNQSTLRAQ